MPSPWCLSAVAPVPTLWFSWCWEYSMTRFKYYHSTSKKVESLAQASHCLPGWHRTASVRARGEVLWKGWHVVVSTISFPKCWKHAYQGDSSAKRTATPSQIVRNVKICNIFWHFSIKCDVFCFPLSAFSRKFLSVHSLCMCRQKETDKLTLLYIVYINIYIIKMTETTEISCVAFLARDKHEFYLL